MYDSSPATHRPLAKRPRRLLRAAVALLATFALPAACAPGEQDGDGRISIDFNEYRGNMATLPDDMFVTAEDGDGIGIGDAFYPFSGVHRLDREDEFLGFGAFTTDGDTHAFGIRERGDIDMRNARLFLEYENETGRPVEGFTVRYTVETWFVGERDNRIRLKVNRDRDGYSAVDSLVSTSNTIDPGRHEDEAGLPIDGSLDEHRTRVEVSFLLPNLTGDESAGFDPMSALEPGETVYFRWQYSNDELTDGSVRSALALNDIEIEPIFAGETEATSDGPGALVFSREAGFHDDPFELELSSSLPGATIYYTLDGSRPDPNTVMSDEEWGALPIESRTRTFEYESPIDIASQVDRENEISLIQPSVFGEEWAWNEPDDDLEKAATVRAVAIAGDSRSTRLTSTYFLGGSHGERFSMPVWSLTTDRGNLFDPEYGIYVPGDSDPPHNYRQRGREWEREAHAEFFEDGERTLGQDLGIRIHGGFSRALPQKTLRLYSRSDYGTSRLNNRFFDTKELDDFNRILLRNAGNEWSRAMLSDVVMQTLVQHLEFDTQHFRPSVVFINGEYWGIQKIRDRYDHHFLETNHGVPREEVVIVENLGIDGAQEVVHTGPDGANQPFIDLRERLGAGEFDTREEVEEYMEVGQFLDYLVAQVYAGNYDWPSNNMRWWRYIGPDVSDDRGPYDGRWRWLMHDLTRSFGHEHTLHFDSVEWVFGDGEGFHPYFEENGRDGHEQPFIFIRGLLEIDAIRHDLLRRFGMHLATTLNTERTLAQIDEKAALLEPEAPRHIERWGQPESMEEWSGYVDEMRHAARERPGILLDHLFSHFTELDGIHEVSVIGADERIVLNSVPLGEETPGVDVTGGTWRGELFGGIPTRIESDELDLSTITIEPEENLESVSRSVDADHIEFVLRGPVEISVGE